MFGRANRRLMRKIKDIEMISLAKEAELKFFVKKLKKLQGKDIVVEWRDSVDGLKGKSTCLLWKISDNGQCVLFKEGKVFSVKSVSWVKDHFVDSFSK